MTIDQICNALPRPIRPLDFCGHRLHTIFVWLGIRRDHSCPALGLKIRQRISKSEPIDAPDNADETPKFWLGQCSAKARTSPLDRTGFATPRCLSQSVRANSTPPARARPQPATEQTVMTLADDNFYLGPTRVFSARQVRMWLESSEPLVILPSTSPSRMSAAIPKRSSVLRRSKDVGSRRAMRGESSRRHSWYDAFDGIVRGATAAERACRPLLWLAPTLRSWQLRSLAECRPQSETSKATKSRVCRV